MCVPMLGMVAGLASSMVSAMGAASAADGEAKQMEYNATVAKINARQSRMIGMQKQEDVGVKADKTRGTAIAEAAKGGVDPYSGSAALVIFGEGGEAEASDKARQYIAAESQAVGDENKARDLEAQAKNKRKAGSIAAAGSFLSGLGGTFKSGASGGGLGLINQGADA